MSLLVATQDPNSTAETYVRQHIRLIAPGRTVALGFVDGDQPPESVPYLAVPRRRPGLRSKAISALALAAHGYPGALVGKQRSQVHDFIRRHAVRAVLAEFGPTGASIMSLCSGLRLPMVVNFHGFDATVMPHSAKVRFAYRRLARSAAGFLCGSEHFRERLIEIGFPPDRIDVVPCGVEIKRFAPGKRDGNRIVAIGRLTPKKAPHLTIEAFAKASPQLSDSTLHIIGDGPLRGHCEQLIARLQLGDRVRLLGAQNHDQVRAALAEADLFVQHSVVAPNGDTESQGISLVEAMAAGLPVIVTDHNGFRETVVHGETGYLVPEGDTDAMAHHIAETMMDADLRRRLGAAGRHRAATRFDATVVTRQMRSVLEQRCPGTRDLFRESLVG